MSKVPAPQGNVVTPREKILAGNRSTSLRFELVSRHGIPLGNLDGVSGGTLEWEANAQVKGGGKLDVSTALDDPDLLKRAKTPDVVYRDRIAEGIIDWVPSVATGGADAGKPRSTVAMTTVDDAPAMLITFTGISADGPDLRPRAPMRVGETYTFAMDVRSPTVGIDPSFSFTAAAPDGFPSTDSGSDRSLLASTEWQTVTAVITMDLAGRSDETIFRLNAASPDGSPTTPSPGLLTGAKIWARNFRIYRGVLRDSPERNVGKDIWPHVQIRPHVTIKGLPEAPLGTFLPSTPIVTYKDGSQTWGVELLDRTSMIAEDFFAHTYSIPAGVNVVDRVWEILRSTGAAVGNPPPASSLPSGVATTLTKGRTWEAGTNKLTIVNDILEAAGYMALWADAEGAFRLSKSVAAKNRPVAYEFIDGENCIYRPEFTIEKDIYSIPNKVVMIGQGDSDTAAPVATALNLDRRSPSSFQNRGRWITDITRGVDAESQTELQAKANARLEQLTAAQGVVTIEHGPVPGLRVNQVVRFARRGGAGIDGLYTVTSIRWPMTPTALAVTKMTEVLDFS